MLLLPSARFYRIWPPKLFLSFLGETSNYLTNEPYIVMNNSKWTTNNFVINPHT